MKLEQEYFATEFEKYQNSSYEVPYMYSLNCGDQFLYFVGTRHTNDPTNKQVPIIEQFWSDFLVRTNGKNDLMLLEGGRKRAPKSNSVKEIIKAEGEIALMAFWANQAQIQMDSPEPSEKEWFEGLTAIFDREEVAYYDFARISYQWNRIHGEKPDFATYINKFLEQDGTNLKWNSFDFTLEHMMQIHNKLFNNKFVESDMAFLSSILDPNLNVSVINKISLYDDSGFRDALIFQNIQKFWESGVNIFLSYGLQHAVVLENALRRLVSNAG